MKNLKATKAKFIHNRRDQVQQLKTGRLLPHISRLWNYEYEPPFLLLSSLKLEYNEVQVRPSYNLMDIVNHGLE